MRAATALLALALAAVLGWQWRDWPPPPPELGAKGAASSEDQAPQPPLENPLDLLTPLGEKDEYAVVTERPLFLPDRRPPSDEPEQEGAASEPENLTELDRMDLNAVMITPLESSAWIRDPSKKELVRLRPGDDLAGWSVQEILSDRVLLERQGETDTLILRDYKNMPPPQPRRRQVARRPPQVPPQQAGKQPPVPPKGNRPGLRQPDVNRPNARQPGMGEQELRRQAANKPNVRQRAGVHNPPRVNARNPQQQR